MLLALFFLATTIYFGLNVAQRLFKKDTLAPAIVFAGLAGAWVTFITSLILGFSELSLLIASIILTLVAWRILPTKKIEYNCIISKQSAIVLIASFVIFSFIAFAVAHYGEEGTLVGIPVDLGFHMAIVSSMAEGNFLPQNPILANEPLSYYYFTDFFSSILVRGGFDFLSAFHFPAILFNAAFTTLIFLLARRLFDKNSVAILAVLLVMLSSSCAFILWAQENPLLFQNPGRFLPNPHFYSNFYGNLGYPVYGMLTYTLLNQRAYPIALAALAIVILLLMEKQNRKTQAAAGIITGLILMFHTFIYAITGLLLVANWCTEKNKRLNALAPLIAVVLAIPQIPLLFQKLSVAATIVTFSPGWLPLDKSPLGIFIFWFQNIGILLVLAAFALPALPKKFKALYAATFIPVIIGNLFIFTPWSWDNIKLFIPFFSLTALIAAKALADLWTNCKLPVFATKFLTIIIFLGLTLTSLLSILTFLSESSTEIYAKNDMDACRWVKQNTPANTIFLTRGEQTCLFALAGRKIFLGDEFWIKSQGYDYEHYLKITNAMLAGNCSLIRENDVEYIYSGGIFGSTSFFNETFLKQHTLLLYDYNNVRVYKIKC